MTKKTLIQHVAFKRHCVPLENPVCEGKIPCGASRRQAKVADVGSVISGLLMKATDKQKCLKTHPFPVLSNTTQVMHALLLWT